MTPPIDPGLPARIRAELQSRPTAALLEIWQANDRAEWSDLAFDLIAVILTERLKIALPPAGTLAWPLALELRTEAALDQADALEASGRWDEALAACDAALRLTPDRAEAHNYRGLLLETLDRMPEAIQAYQTAVRLAPSYNEARNNLRMAQAALTGRPGDIDRALPAGPEPGLIDGSAVTAWSENETRTGSELPAVYYLSKTALVLPGWPGHRTRPGRSGLDPLDTYFEQAHITGLLLRQLFTGQLRLESWISIVLSVMVALELSLPLILVGGELLAGDTNSLLLLAPLSIYWIPGLALWRSIYASLGKRLRAG
jgi:tetratricopeptide (TPR) repeat protein